MESLVMFGKTFQGKSVWVSGHTGFKGSWLTLWLLRLGAKVHGFSLPPPTEPSLFEQAGLAESIAHEIGDVRDRFAVQQSLLTSTPDFVFHLAAQPLVRRSYLQPLETVSTNVIGTAHVLDALREMAKPCIAVIVTSDKCYANNEQDRAFTEVDHLGGHDPYSASKAACEILTSAYRDSYFQNSPVRVSSARAGNVIGGGDWAHDRLVPDCIRALSKGSPIQIRNPDSIRPWQHVLEPLGGYLRLAQAMTQNSKLCGAYNFGPSLSARLSVLEIVRQVLELWPGSYEILKDPSAPAEAKLLQLSIDKARSDLGWSPILGQEDSVKWTLDWYQSSEKSPSQIREFTENQLFGYERLAAGFGMIWEDSI